MKKLPPSRLPSFAGLPHKGGGNRMPHLRSRLMPDKTFLHWPFFDERHRALAAGIEAWCAANLPIDHADLDRACRDLVRQFGRDGWLTHTAPEPDATSPFDVRTLC